MQTQCLVQGDEGSTIEVKVRFLHVVERKVAKKTDEALQFVDELRVGGELHLSWDEAIEREIAVGRFEISDLLESPMRVGIDIPGGSREEPLVEPGGEVVGAVVRGWRPRCGTVEVEAELLREGVFQVTVGITNTTSWEGQDRESTLRQT